jgi:hypothetical protein
MMHAVCAKLLTLALRSRNHPGVVFGGIKMFSRHVAVALAAVAAGAVGKWATAALWRLSTYPRPTCRPWQELSPDNDHVDIFPEQLADIIAEQ